MKPVSSKLTALASAGALALAATAALAQPSQSQGPAQGPDLHAVLHIRPDQEGAWRAYQAAQQPPAALIAQLRASAQRLGSLPTPQRIDLIEQNLQGEMAARHHMYESIRHFYAALSPDQQRIFDQITMPRPGQGAPQR